MLFKTPPLDIIDVTADMHHSGGIRPMPPLFIVLHHTGAWPALLWLTTDKGSDVSSHRYIEPGRAIFKLVDDSKIAYTQGFADVGPWSDALAKNFNTVCLSIEGCFDPSKDKSWSPDVVWKMACQTCEWIGRYGFLPVVYHSQIDARKDDPLRFPRATFDKWLLDLVFRAMAGTLKNWQPTFDMLLDVTPQKRKSLQ